MKKLLLSMSLIICNFICFGQFEAGIKICGGISEISNSAIKKITDTKIDYVPSGNGGLFFTIPIGGKGYLGTELLFFQMNGKEKWYTDFSGYKTVYASYNIYKHVSYISVPLYYGLKFNKIRTDLGIQIAYGIIGSMRAVGEINYNGNIVYMNEEIDEPGIKRLDFGMRGGLKYEINSFLILEANYYYGLFNIIRDYDGYGWIWKNRQATLGIRFDILNFANRNRDSKTKNN